MPSIQSVSCPKCGNPSPEKVSERRADLSGGFFAPPSGAQKETIYVFHCKCGTTFTHSARDGELPKQSAGVKAGERVTLALEAQRLQREIGARVDNPNGVFRGDGCEACI